MYRSDAIRSISLRMASLLYADLFSALFHQSGIKQLAFTGEDGVGDGGDLAVEILEGKAGFEMKIAGLKAFGASGGKALQMVFTTLALAVGEFGFFLHQPSGDADIMGDKYVAGERDIGDDAVMHATQLSEAFSGEADVVFGTA